MSTHPISLLAERFPQLRVPLSPGARDSTLYKQLVLRGQESDLVPPGFSFSAADELKAWQTPVGPAEVLYLENRADFERCVCALAYRCEPRVVPASMGATTISGLNDWKKIRDHRKAYEANGGTAWQDEFKRFIAEPANYRATLILVSSGFYSAVSPEAAGLLPEEWLDRSLTIRIYHELTHFVCRRRYPQDVDPIRDEVIADAIGLLAAFGTYDPRKSTLFLGIEAEEYRRGGRLENYSKEDLSLAASTDMARIWVQRMVETLGQTAYTDPFAPLHRLMKPQQGNSMV